MASNPSKNFLYYDFYKPYKEGTLLNYRKFIPALVTDNPFISPHYIKNLKKLDKVSKERLLYGNFEYDDDPARLMEYDAIIDFFTNTVEESDKKYMTVDVARFGSDKTVVILWKGMMIYKIHVYTKQSTKETRQILEALSIAEKIPRSHILIDEDGVGGGVVDELPGCKGFVNNSRQIDISLKHEEKIPNYTNLKSQCYFYLADYINKRMIGCYKDIPVEYKELIIEDFEQIKRKDADKDGKLAVVPKDKIKEQIGRSTDFGDAIMMSMKYELTRQTGWFFF